MSLSLFWMKCSDLSFSACVGAHSVAILWKDAKRNIRDSFPFCSPFAVSLLIIHAQYKSPAISQTDRKYQRQQHRRTVYTTCWGLAKKCQTVAYLWISKHVINIQIDPDCDPFDHSLVVVVVVFCNLSHKSFTLPKPTKCNRSSLNINNKRIPNERIGTKKTEMDKHIATQQK